MAVPRRSAGAPSEAAPEPATGPSSGYWYETTNATPALTAVREFLRADERMRRRLQRDMDMNETDLRAVRMLAGAELVGRPVSPRDLARGLGISTASTTKLLDRLEADGRLRRERHPTDRRGLHVVLTPSVHHEVRDTLGVMHARMREVADDLTPAESAAVVRFLTSLTSAVEA